MSAALIAGVVRWGAGNDAGLSGTGDERPATVVGGAYVRFFQHPPDPGGDPLKYYGPVSERLAALAAVLILIGVTGWIENGEKG